MNKFVIGVDATGGDYAPKEQVLGTIEAIKEYDIDAKFLGNREDILDVLKNIDYPKEKVQIIDCKEKIDTDESPVKAVRQKKDSSIVRAMDLIKKRDIGAFISSGNTGAVLAAGTLLNGRIKGIDRPALTTVIPTTAGGCVLMDLGANALVKAENLDQFATMGYIYAQKFLNKKNPKVALLNIGAEENKGTQVVQDAYKLLKQNPNINFAGNVEARELLSGKFDVVVADGFSGNIALKSIEGTAITIMSELKKSLLSSTVTKIGALLSKSAFKRVKKMLDYEEYGGAVLLGINNIVIKAHGSSNAKAFKNAVKQAVVIQKSGIIEEIKSFVQNSK